jgi:hypothetical protein
VFYSSPHFSLSLSLSIVNFAAPVPNIDLVYMDDDAHDRAVAWMRRYCDRNTDYQYSPKVGLLFCLKEVNGIHHLCRCPRPGINNGIRVRLIPKFTETFHWVKANYVALVLNDPVTVSDPQTSVFDNNKTSTATVRSCRLLLSIPTTTTSTTTTTSALAVSVVDTAPSRALHRDGCLFALKVLGAPFVELGTFTIRQTIYSSS